ncbi:hypothetical protein [Desulfomonile tiedjei]|uniref:Uncharacterized protein n=1 Tax=Desulfomonile tiedjei (strain ATCC 49306 / DSM 6799 / DCB-1) TaxID=706587 RepID=I4CA77_DESTA|nr:hypothetical protein [Desulfomonile tiedjei]AFM26468.1 hypothetical protein Desti_3826 [Desulfomonile tiedjei DSM 6799]
MFRWLLIGAMAIVLMTSPVAISQDQEIVNCCIRPCSCLPNAKPQCVKITKEECERKRGEVVADCMLCD